MSCFKLVYWSLFCSGRVGLQNHRIGPGRQEGREDFGLGLRLCLKQQLRITATSTQAGKESKTTASTAVQVVQNAQTDWGYDCAY